MEPQIKPHTNCILLMSVLTNLLFYLILFWWKKVWGNIPPARTINERAIYFRLQGHRSSKGDWRLEALRSGLLDLGFQYISLWWSGDEALKNLYCALRLFFIFYFSLQIFLLITHLLIIPLCFLSPRSLPRSTVARGKQNRTSLLWSHPLLFCSLYLPKFILYTIRTLPWHTLSIIWFYYTHKQ